MKKRWISYLAAFSLFNRLIKLFKTLVVVARIINVPLIGENNTRNRVRGRRKQTRQTWIRQRKLPRTGVILRRRTLRYIYIPMKSCRGILSRKKTRKHWAGTAKRAIYVLNVSLIFYTDFLRCRNRIIRPRSNFSSGSIPPT